MTINDKLREGIDRDELVGLIRLLPHGSKLRINRNMLIVSTGNAHLQSLEQAIAGKQLTGQEKAWEIWMEGFRATGDEALASKVGDGRGLTFEDAVLDYYRRNPDPSFSPDSMSVWGCKLYPTESQARATYG